MKRVSTVEEIAEARAQRRLGIATQTLAQALAERAATKASDVHIEVGSFGEYVHAHLEDWEPTFPLEMLDTTCDIIRKLYAETQTADGGACVLFFRDEDGATVSAVVTIFMVQES